jgi:electron transfer flavoprotein alpha subunit
MSEILVFCEKDEVAFELLSKGMELGESLNSKLAAAVAGDDAEERAKDYFSHGADKVYLVKGLSLKDFYADIYAQALYQIAQNYGSDLLLLGSTKRGKELAPRVAQKLDAGCVTDAIGMEIKDGDLVINRYTLGGNTVSSELIKTPRKVVSVMPKTFKAAEREAKEGELIDVGFELKGSKLKIVERREKKGESVNLEEADTLVCIGRGLEKKEDLGMVEALAGALKGEVGCTKSLASDWQWLSEDRMVGLSGKKCQPNLYVSVGISGQIQHIVGVRGSKIIAVINKDKNAPIFKVADYGIVGDLYEVMPKLTEKLGGTS